MDDDMIDPGKTMGKPWENHGKNGDLYSNQSLVGGDWNHGLL